jgi:hypothetical protein
MMKKCLITLPEHLRSPPVFSRVRVTRSLVLYVCFVERCLSFCPFSFGHCVVCSSSIYGFWLPLWYHQTHLILNVVGTTRFWDNLFRVHSKSKDEKDWKHLFWLFRMNSLKIPKGVNRSCKSKNAKQYNDYKR